MEKRNASLDSDGVPGRVLLIVVTELSESMMRVPQRLPSNRNRVEISKSGYNSETGQKGCGILYVWSASWKNIERIVINRVSTNRSHMDPVILDNYFGFRVGHSTIDAIDRVLKSGQSAISQGGIALTMSIDIFISFNSLLWNKITTALTKHSVPVYFTDVISR